MFDQLGNKPSSQRQIQQSNSKLVFKLINDYDGISRAKIASITKLSPTTISSLTEQLINNELVIETGEKVVKSSGRRPILLDINKDGACFIGVDLQEKEYHIALYDLKCNLLVSSQVELLEYNELGTSLINQINNLFKKQKIKQEKLKGICIGAPGLIDIDNKKIILSTVLPINKQNTFCNQLEKKFPNITIRIMNESSLAAYAEKQFVEEVSKFNNIMYVDIHSGIGAGIILDGNIFRGSSNLAGEFGHISVDINGPTCKCGAKGCLEVVANTKSIINKLKKYDTLEEIAWRYNDGDNDVKKVVHKNAKYIAYGINNAVNLINPEAIIIGGKIKIFGQKYVTKLVKEYKKIALDKNKDIKILLSKVEGNPITLGGAKYLLDQLLMR